MKLASILKSLSLTLALGSVMATPAQAFRLFTGEDLGIGAGGRPPTTPNSDAARDDFLNNLVPGVGTESFETSPVNLPPTLLYYNLPQPALGYYLGGVGVVTEVSPNNTDGSGRYPSTGNRFVTAPGDVNIRVLSATGPAQLAAFGFYATDIGDVEGNLTVTLRDASNTAIDSFALSDTTGNNRVESGGIRFFGVIAEENDPIFSRITITDETGGFDVFGIDDIVIAGLNQVDLQPETEPAPTPIPENSPLVGLFPIGLLVLCSIRQRQQNQRV